MNRLTRTAAALAATGALLLGATACLPGGDTIEVTAYFPDAAGLFEGNDVGVLGVPVGTITEIQPDGGQVKVVMEIDADRAVPKDAGAAVVARSVATDRYVELTPVYRTGPRLADGDSISRDRTRTPVEFDEVLESLADFANGIAGNEQSRDAIRGLVESGSAAMRGQGQQLSDTIGKLGAATSAVNGQTGNATAALTSLDQLVATIAANEQVLREFLRQVARGSAMLNEQRAAFRAALRSLDKAVRTIAAFSKKHKKQIVRSLNRSSRLMRTVVEKQGSLTEILRVLPLVLQNLELAERDGRLPARIDPLVIAPLGGLLQQICSSLPLGLCDTVTGTDIPGGPSLPEIPELPIPQVPIVEGVLGGVLGGPR